MKDRRGRGPAPLLLLASLCVALLAVAGYVYSVFGFYGVSRFTPMALNTALALTVLCAGGLCARPDAWPVAGVLRAWFIGPRHVRLSLTAAHLCRPKGRPIATCLSAFPFGRTGDSRV